MFFSIVLKNSGGVVSDSKKPVILVVEDNEYFMRQILRDGKFAAAFPDYEIKTTNNFEEAEEILINSNVAALVTDNQIFKSKIKNPFKVDSSALFQDGYKGYNLICNLRNGLYGEEKKRDIPVIFETSSAYSIKEQGFKLKNNNEGFIQILLKYYKFGSDIIEILDGYLKGKIKQPVDFGGILDRQHEDLKKQYRGEEYIQIVGVKDPETKTFNEVMDRYGMVRACTYVLSFKEFLKGFPVEAKLTFLNLEDGHHDGLRVFDLLRNRSGGESGYQPFNREMLEVVLEDIPLKDRFSMVMNSKGNRLGPVYSINSQDLLFKGFTPEQEFHAKMNIFCTSISLSSKKVTGKGVDHINPSGKKVVMAEFSSMKPGEKIKFLSQKVWTREGEMSLYKVFKKIYKDMPIEKDSKGKDVFSVVTKGLSIFQMLKLEVGLGGELPQETPDNMVYRHDKLKLATRGEIPVQEAFWNK